MSIISDNHNKQIEYMNELKFKIPPSGSKASDFIVGKYLGCGAYGTVFSCTLNPEGFRLALDSSESKGTRKYNLLTDPPNDVNNETYALKIIDICKIKELDHTSYIDTEINILSTYSHPSIIKLYEWFYDEKSIYLLMEYAPCLDLYEYMVINNHIEPKQCISYMRQLWKCMIYMRDNHIIHRDIKPENLLIFDDGETIKLGDFGLGFIIGDEKPSGIRVGTLEYLAPEIIMKHEHDYACDLWASGILFYELITGTTPNNHLYTENELMKATIADKIILHIPLDTQFNVLCEDIICKILQKNPINRPTLEHCLLYLNECEKVI